MRKKILVIFLVLVVVLSITACEKQPSAEEIVDRVIESFANIRTYQFDIDETINMTSGVDREEDSFTLSSNGTVDVENRQMRVHKATTKKTIFPRKGPAIVFDSASISCKCTACHPGRDCISFLNMKNSLPN